VATPDTYPHLPRLLDAIVTVGSDLELGAVLQRIVGTAVDLVDARYGALGVLDEGGNGLSDFIPVGLTSAEIAAIGDLPAGHGLLGLLIVDPHPIRIPDLNEHPDSFGFPEGHPPMTSFLGVPIRVRGEVYGNLYLTDKDGGGPFTELDEELTVALATAAGVAIDNARLAAHAADAALLRDRERIARDLHDLVIQRLFATGLTLQSATRLAAAGGDELTTRLQQAVDDIDETIRQIRSTIFELQTARGPDGVRSGLVALCNELSGILGTKPALLIDGPVDTAVPNRVTQHLLAAAREALTNVAKHAEATSVTLEVALDPARDRLRMVVRDDGCGLGETSGDGRGLRNLESRARALGGAFTVGPGTDGGTVVRWEVPIAR
jgi:signal transduction histidine kinase